MTIECIIHNQTIFNQWHPKKLLTDACYVKLKYLVFYTIGPFYCFGIFFLKKRSADVLSSENK